jgi:hypothetical protein
MAAIKLKDRVEVLEMEVARLRARVEGPADSSVPGWRQIWGIFANDPAFEEAMRLGREYRESLRPKAAKRVRS